jgi:dTDP-4-dehydrorhamnose 3,5-epimerase
MLIPEGFAHGFLSLANDTIFHYKCSNFYSKESEGGILWNDKTIDIKWGVNNPIVSDKDLILPAFNTSVHVL